LAGDEPLQEALHAWLMAALASSGELAAVLRLFAELRARLAAELGVEPSLHLQAAHLGISGVTDVVWTHRNGSRSGWTD
jgi:DNA-binding SARP family transcriptional activator